MIEPFRQTLLPRAAALLPVPLLHRLACETLVLPYYHIVTDDRAPHVEHLYAFRNVGSFQADLEFFLAHFEPITAESLLRALEGGERLPKRAMLMTFDDGFREMHDIVAPILRAKGVPAVFFLNSAMHGNQELCMHQKVSLLLEAIELQGDDFPTKAALDLLVSEGLEAASLSACLRSIPWARRGILDDLGRLCGCDFDGFLRTRKPYLDTPQVEKMLGQGFEFGGHSVDHPLYASLELSEQLRQTRESMQFVTARFNLRRKLFAFPHMDIGVSRQFFEIVQSDGTVDVTFGTSNPKRDCVPRSFQRFSMEKTRLSAGAILGRQALRRLKLCATFDLPLLRGSNVLKS